MSAQTADPRPPARVAKLVRTGKFLVAEPFFQAGPRVVVSRDKRYDVGDLVLLGPSSGGSRRGGSRRPPIARRLGRPDVARDVIGALMLDRGLARGFDPAVEREARARVEGYELSGDGGRLSGDGGRLPGAGRPLSGDGRRDLRELATFTIDPATARDFDDAISAEALGGSADGAGPGRDAARTGGGRDGDRLGSGDGDGDGDGWRVWVHIADVAAYVVPRSPVDREAYRRATSVYVPGAVEPMLPAELSNEACSLVPGEVRPTVTVEMTVGARGVRRASMYRSLIRSDARLDYDRVDRIFAGGEAAAEPWGEPLAAARAAAAALAALRSGRPAVVLESAEPDFRFDRRGDVVSTELSVATESHRLIEQLMIAANEQVAGFLSERKIPTLYRVHERPEATAVERLIDQLTSLGVPTPPGVVGGSQMTPQQAADLAGEISAMVADWVGRHRGRGARALNSLVLRSLKQAYYDSRNRGHAGLASSRYCHFTSPIRRYPDLICHRGLLAAMAGEPAPDGAWVQAAGPWCSTREREAMVIERDADDVASCFALEGLLSGGGLDREQPLSGEVVGLIGAGAFVAFGDRGQFQGMLPVRRLGGDWWELNEERTILIGTRNGGAIRLGDTVEVRVGRIDAPRGRVDLLAADAAET